MFGEQKLLVGVIHLPPLPGYPESPGMDAVVDKALADLRALETGPVEAILVENGARATSRTVSRRRAKRSPR